MTSQNGIVEDSAPRRTYDERLRMMRLRWCEEWWSITMGSPIGNRLNALIADVRWVTPNRITIAGFLCKIAICPLLIAGVRAADIAAIVLLQLAVIADCMDGSLARYRKTPSALGAYLDKVTDAIGYMLIFAGLGWRTYTETGDAAAIVAALAIGTSFVVRGYVFWVVAAIEKQAGAVKQTTGVDTRLDGSKLSSGERARLYVRSMIKIVAFAESDLYFWIALGMLVGELRVTVYGLAIATGVWFVAIMIGRLMTVIRLERTRRP